MAQSQPAEDPDILPPPPIVKTTNIFAYIPGLSFLYTMSPKGLRRRAFQYTQEAITMIEKYWELIDSDQQTAFRDALKRVLQMAEAIGDRDGWANIFVSEVSSPLKQYVQAAENLRSLAERLSQTAWAKPYAEQPDYMLRRNTKRPVNTLATDQVPPSGSGAGNDAGNAMEDSLLEDDNFSEVMGPLKYRPYNAQQKGVESTIGSVEGGGPSSAPNAPLLSGQ